MDRLFQILLDAGYPPESVNWLRRHRLATIITLAIGAWALFIGVGYLIWRLFIGF